MKVLAFILAFCVSSIASAQVYWSSQRIAGITDDIWGITFANDTFVAVTGKGRLLSSTDGQSWSVQTVAANTWLLSVCWGKGLWVVVGDNGSIYYSADLKVWTAASAATSNRLNGVAFTNQTFAAVGEGGVVLTSTDAQNWTVRVPASTGYLRGLYATTAQTSTFPPVRYVGSFIASGTLPSSPILQSINDGVNWSTSPIGSGYGPGPITGEIAILAGPGASSAAGYAGSLVGAGANGLITTFGIAQLPGGLTTDTPVSIIGVNATFTAPSKVFFRAAAFGSNQYVVGGENGTIYTSGDAGKSWVQRFSGNSPQSLSTSTLLAAAYSDTLQLFVVTGTGGEILLSNASPTVLYAVATRGPVTLTDQVIGGIAINGSAQKKVIFRASGPALASQGVSNVLPDPVLTIYNSAGQVIGTNTRWGTNANLTELAAATLKAGLVPFAQNSNDSALVLTLAPGGYTAVITSASKSTGTTLFEAYTP